MVPIEYAKRPWTSEEVALLSQHRSVGVPTWEIATKLNRSITDIENKIQKSLQRAWSVQETKLFWQLIEENKSHEEIARELGRSVFAIRGKLKFSKRATIRPHKWTAEHKAMLAEYFRRGLNDVDVANALPFETTSVKVAIVRRRMGLRYFRDSRTQRDWTLEDDMQVRQFFAQGLSDSTIGSRLSPQRSTQSVKKRRYKILKLTGPSRTPVPWSDLEVEEMYRMVEQGLSRVEISEKLSGGSRSVNSINRKRRMSDLVRFHRENADTLKARDPSMPIRPKNATQPQKETIKSEQLPY